MQQEFRKKEKKKKALKSSCKSDWWNSTSYATETEAWVDISSGNISLCLAGKEFGNRVPLSGDWTGIQDCTGNAFKSGNGDAFCMEWGTQS